MRRVRRVRSRAQDAGLRFDLDAQRATTTHDPLEIDLGQHQEAAGWGRIEEELARGAPRAQELANLGVVDPQEAARRDELAAADDRAGLDQEARDGVRERRDELDASAHGLALDADGERPRERARREQQIELIADAPELREGRERAGRARSSRSGRRAAPGCR